MAALLLFLIFGSGIVAAYCVNGFALMHLWRWFQGEELDPYAAWASAFVRPAMALLVGWIVHRLML